MHVVDANQKPAANFIHGTISKIDFAGSTLVIKLQSDLGEILLMVSGDACWRFMGRDAEKLTVSFKHASIVPFQ